MTKHPTDCPQCETIMTEINRQQNRRNLFVNVTVKQLQARCRRRTRKAIK